MSFFNVDDPHGKSEKKPQTYFNLGSRILDQSKEGLDEDWDDLASLARFDMLREYAHTLVARIERDSPQAENLRIYRERSMADAARKIKPTKREFRYKEFDVEYCFDEAKRLLEAEGKEVEEEMQAIRDDIKK